MQRNAAMRWFGPFLLAAAVVLGLSTFIQARMMAAAPASRGSIAAPGAAPQVGPTPVNIVPSHIEVVARRLVPVARADAPSRRGQPG